MRQRLRFVLAFAVVLSMAFASSAFAHPDDGSNQEEFPGEGVRSDKEEKAQDDVEGGHLPPKQENVTVIGKEEITNPNLDDDGENLTNDGRVTDVFAFGDYAYLGAFYEPTCENTGVHVVDIADITAPEEVEEAFIPTSPGSYVSEGVQVITIGPRDVLIHQNETCFTEFVPPPEDPNQGGISLWDVTDPLNAQPLALHQGDFTAPETTTAKTSPSTVHSFYAWTADDGRTYAVLVDNEEFTDVDIMDITNPGNPVLINDTLDLAELFQVDQESPENLTSIFSHDFDVQRSADGRFVMAVNYWDGGYVLLDVTDPTPGNVKLIAESDFAELDEERLARGQEISPEGNGHQMEQSPNLDFAIGTDEDFAPFRQVATSKASGDEFPSGSGDTTVPIGPDTPLDVDSSVFVGPACDADGALPAPTAEGQLGVGERGVCTFEEKLQNIQDAGYDAGAIMNSAAPGNCTNVLNMATGDFDYTIQAIFIGRDFGFELFGAEYDEDACQNGEPTPFPPGTEGEGVTVEAIFEGWGYVRLFATDIGDENSNGGSISQIDTYAIPEAQDEAFATDFGDLSIHEVAIDPDPDSNLAYFSYYSGGFRVAEYGPEGLTEVGAFIDEGGSNFWGVEFYTDDDGEEYVLASDRDYGLYVFQYDDMNPVPPGPDPDPSPDPDPDPDPDPTEPPVVGDDTDRFFGQGRIETAIEISQGTYESATTVVLARADDYPDALAGSPLAVDLAAPLLLNPQDSLNSDVLAEIQRLGATEVVLLGREAALTETVRTALEAADLTVRRVGGSSRFDTAALIAGELGDYDEAFLVEGGNEDPSRGFPDALSVAGLAASQGLPILLTGADTLAPATEVLLTDNLDVTIVGGPVAVTGAVQDEVDGGAGDVSRLFGSNRYGTSVAVANEAVARGLDLSTIWIATGLDFPDALAAGASAGAIDTTVLLVDGQGLDASPASATFLEENNELIDLARIAGGINAVSAQVEADILTAIQDD